MEALKIIFGLYLGTIVLALTIAIFQFFIEKNRIYLYSVLYWSAVLLSTTVNIVITDNYSLLFPLAGVGTFASQYILAKVMCEIRGLEFKPKIPVLVMLVMLISSGVLNYFRFPFEMFATVLVLGGAFPVFYAFYLVVKKKKTPFTSSQWLFFTFALLLTLHYLDYSFTKNNPELFAVGLVIAFMLIHGLSGLIPMVVNEHSLFLRNQNLELEIKDRVADLRKADQQIWESDKLASLGRFSGVLAHEINTPLATISMAAQYILNHTVKSESNIEGISKKAKKIKEVVTQITSITSILKTASGDQVGTNFVKFNLSQVLSTITRSTQEYCLKKSIAFSFEDLTLQSEVLGNENEIAQSIRNLLFDAIEGQADISKPWIHVKVFSHDSKIQIVISDSRSNRSQNHINDMTIFSKNDHANTSTNQNYGLTLVVAKAIFESHHGSIDFDFETENTRIYLTLPNSSKDILNDRER